MTNYDEKEFLIGEKPKDDSDYWYDDDSAFSQYDYDKLLEEYDNLLLLHENQTEKFSNLQLQYEKLQSEIKKLYEDFFCLNSKYVAAKAKKIKEDKDWENGKEEREEENEKKSIGEGRRLTFICSIVGILFTSNFSEIFAIPSIDFLIDNFPLNIILGLIGVSLDILLGTAMGFGAYILYFLADLDFEHMSTKKSDCLFWVTGFVVILIIGIGRAI